METFEYKTVTVDCKDMEHSQDKLTAQLNRWGKEGWELVSSLTHPYLERFSEIATKEQIR